MRSQQQNRLIVVGLQSRSQVINRLICTNERYEIDFLTQTLDGELYLYQICWDVNNQDTIERETRALDIAKKDLGIDGILITPDHFLKMFI